MHSPEGLAESDTVGVYSNNAESLLNQLPCQVDLCVEENATKDNDNEQNSGWFEVKKKNRVGKSHKLVTNGRKTFDASIKPKTYLEQHARAESRICTSFTEHQESFVISDEQVLLQSKDFDSRFVCKEAVGSTTTKSSENISMALAIEKKVCNNGLKEVVDTPKFKWGNLEDEDLSQNQHGQNATENDVAKAPVMCQSAGIHKDENSTLYLEGGKQTSTKEINDTSKTSTEAVFVSDGKVACNSSGNSNASEHPHMITRGEQYTYAEATLEDLDMEGLPICISEHLTGDDMQPLAETVGSSNVWCIGEQIGSVNTAISVEKNNAVSGALSSTVLGSDLGKENVVDSVNIMATDISKTSLVHHDRGGTGAKPSMEFSLAAKMLIGNLEENQSIESKERFRQRLWCYLFENLNRAIDELYFLCELECDMDQILEALLVLKEAGLDFNELKSRVEGFEKVRKQSCASQILYGANLESSFAGKVEHRRPHAIAWEVRRMACSPHRAEILSSSLEAFKKVRQINLEKNSLSQSKRREAAQLLIEESFAEFSSQEPLPANSFSGMNETIFEPAIDSHAARHVNDFPFPDVLGAKGVNNTYGKVSDSKELAAVRALSEGPLTGEICSIATITDVSACPVEIGVSDNVMHDKANLLATRTENYPALTANTEVSIKSVEKRVSIVDNQRDKKTPKTRSSMDAWKVKRNWEDVLASPLKSLSQTSRSPCTGSRSAERVKVLHDKLMSPERKRKSPSEMKKEVDEKQARATRIRRELENERVQRLQKTTEKLNRVSEWQAVRSSKLREGMHARQQRGESRHEAHLAEIARRAGDESSKVSEVRFITSLNEENKKLSLKQRLQDSETRRAERLQSMKIKQKEEVAREEAVLERRRIIEAERLQRLAEAQRRKEEAKTRRDEERKAASAAREARAVEQVRKKEVRAKAQQEVTELQAQKLMEKLRESELRRKVYLEQIRERATMDSREQASPSGRLSLSRDSQLRNQAVNESDGSQDKENRQTSGNKGSPGSVLRRHALKKRVKKIRQRLMAKKYDCVQPPPGAEGSGIGSMAIAAAARSKIGRWLQDLQRCQLAKKAGASGVGFIVAEMVKYFDGKVAELHAARQAGLVDFIATALPASHTSKAEASQTTLSLLRILKVLLALPANRSYFISRNLLPPLIPMLAAALENFSSQDVINANASGMGLNDEKADAIGEVLNGLLECVVLIMDHNNMDERQISMKDDLIELLVACEIIHHLRDMFSLFDRPQVEGAPFPAPVLFGLNLLQAITANRGKIVGLPYEAHLSTMIKRQEIRDSVVVPPACGPNISQTGGSHVELDQTKCGTNSTETSSTSKVVINEASVGEPDRTLGADTVVMNIATPESIMPTGPEVRVTEACNEKALTRPDASSSYHPTSFLVSAIAETGLVSLPSLLTAVLLQTNPRSAAEQGGVGLPSNFNEVATCVLKVLNNLARLDLELVQNLLAMPDLQMEFFHLVSFLLTHCTCKWSNPDDQVASLLLETLLLLGYFALLHPGNQAVLRWGKSPTILHKICDLPFAFFSNPSLMPVLVGTLLAVCYESEQNRDVIQEEISVEMLLSLLKTSRKELDMDVSIDSQAGISIDATANDERLDNQLLEEEVIPAMEEIKRVIDDSAGSDSDTNCNIRQPVVPRSGLGKASNADTSCRKGYKTVLKAGASIEETSFAREISLAKSSTYKNQVKGSALSTSMDTATQLLRKAKVSMVESSAKISIPATGLALNKRLSVSCADNPVVTSDTDICGPNGHTRSDLLLKNRFPACLLDKAQAFFSAGL